MMNNTRILFMGTPDLAKNILKALLENGYNVIACITQEDKPVGRKHVITPTPVKKLALEHNIPVYQPHRIRNDFEFVKDLNVDLIVTCAYGQILPHDLLTLPTIGAINVHGSLLPKYRGASPIQECLKQGDTITGVTIMEMVDEMDAGDIFYQQKIVIDPSDNYTSLLDKFSLCGSEALLKALPGIIDKSLKKIPQNKDEVTFCGKIKKEDEHLSLDLLKKDFVNYVRALSLTPGGYLYFGEEIFKILECEVISDELVDKVGTIVKADKQGLYLQLKDGIIALKRVQRQGKKIMTYKDFLNGEKNFLHIQLS